MKLRTMILKTLFKWLVIVSILVPNILSGEERKSKEYPLKPRYIFSGDKDPHCELWSLEREPGKAATCRRRATKSTKGLITCRFKTSYVNDDDETLTMCVYEKAGYNLENLTISSETYICEKEFKCKR